jgi:hypothetical protein
LFSDQLADFAGADFFAAAHHRICFGGRDPALLRAVQRVQKRPCGAMFCEFGTRGMRTLRAISVGDFG